MVKIKIFLSHMSWSASNWTLSSPRRIPSQTTFVKTSATRSQSLVVKDRSASLTNIQERKFSTSIQNKVSHLKKRVSQVTDQFADVSHRNLSESPPIELCEQACVVLCCLHVPSLNTIYHLAIPSQLSGLQF